MKTADQVMTFVPKRISRKLKDYVTNEVLGYSRYLFIEKVNDKYIGYCTHCKKEYEVDRLKHKSRTCCKRCKSDVRVQYARYGRSSMIDLEVFVFYEKALKDKQAITARVFQVSRDYRHDYKNTETEYRRQVSYLFKKGGAWKVYNAPRGENFLYEQITSVYSNDYAGKRKHICKKSIDEAIKDTPFQYFEYERYAYQPAGKLLDDMVKLFALAAHHPCIEYLTKLGMKEFVEIKLHGFDRTYSAINWNGQSINEVLKVDKQNVKEVINEAGNLTMRSLRMYQIMKEEDSSTTVREAIDITNPLPEQDYHDNLMAVKKITKEKTKKIISYIDKLIEKEYEGKIGETFRALEKIQAMQTYRDYIRDCEALEKDMKNSIILYPGDLSAAHAETIKQRSYQEDKILDKKLKKRAENLKKMAYENGNLIVSAFSSTGEIISEGKVLKHCVGQYIDDYVAGRTILLKIRRKEQLDKPYYTMEVKSGQVTQFYGYKNNINIKKSQEVIDFVKEFEEEILNKREGKTA